ncbi:MAG: TlpA disulfide reductase family protein [Panacibacter sp.]
MIFKKMQLLFFGIILLFVYSCNEVVHETLVSLNIKGAAGKKIFLYKEPFINEQAIKLDSAIVVDLNHTIPFRIKENEERLYMLRVENSNKGYYFINDAASVHINANDINGKYSVDFSPASLSWKRFTDSQLVLTGKLRNVARSIDSLKKKGDALNDSFKINYDALLREFSNNYILYADTVQSPSAFMAAYGNIDFGKQYKDFKVFVNKAAARFPGYRPVADLKKEVYDMISIFEEEYNIGDTLPVISLPGISNEMFSTASLKGKYYLIDFWASWCPQCYIYNAYKKQSWAEFKSKNFAMVSVALDDEKEKWKDVINKEGLNWTQLIDENMWRGIAANTLKFDSIPFNFLVAPGGVIVAKAIKPDSLSKVVGSYVK